MVVDLLETFNWLLGLRVQKLGAPERYDATFLRDNEGRLTVESMKATEDGRWWFRGVEGLLPDDRRALILWRNRPGGDAPDGIEEDNTVLNEWFASKYADGRAVDLVYVNGDHNVENLKRSDQVWTGHVIEDHFQRLMFEGEGERAP